MLKHRAQQRYVKEVSRPIKIITPCGSMKSSNQMIDIALDLELKHDYVVSQCAYNQKGIMIKEENVLKLDVIHKRKIENSDAIYVVNTDGYIGMSA